MKQIDVRKRSRPLLSASQAIVHLKTPAAGSSFTRATVGTIFDGNGQMVEVAIDAERYTYDPVTLEYLGQMAEVAAAQLLSAPECNDGVGWVDASGSTSVNGSDSILGQFIGVTVTSGAGLSSRLETDTVFAVTSGVVESWIAIYQAGTSGKVQMRVREDGGNASNANGVIGSLATAVETGGTLVVLSEELLDDGVTWIAKGTWTPNFTGNALMGIGPNGADGETIIAVAANLKTEPQPTSFVLDQSTRAKDVAPVTVGSWFNPVIGTFVCEWASEASGSEEAYIIHAHDGTVNNKFHVYRNTSTGKVRVASVDGGVGSGVDSTIAFAGTHKIAVTIEDGQPTTFSVDGEDTITMATNCGVAEIDTINIGSSDLEVRQPNGTIKEIPYYDRGFDAATLPAYST